MQKVSIILALITIGCILGPIGTVIVMYHSNLAGLVITPQVKQLTSNNGNNNNGNNNNNNNGNNGNNNNNSNNNNNNNNNNQNNNNSGFSNNGNVNNNNPQVNSPTNSFGSSGQFAATVQTSQAQVSDQFSANINILIAENGNNIQLSMDLSPTNVPGDLQSTFATNNDYLLNFAGTTTESSSGTQITASDQGSLNPGGSFNIDLAGSLDQNQDTLTITLTSTGNSQASITTLTSQPIVAHQNNNNNNGNNGNNNNSNNNNNNNNSSNNNNDNGGVNFDNAASQISTSDGKITLVFNITNSDSQSETISKMSGTLKDNNDQTTLGTVSLQSSVTIPADQSSLVTASGTLTSQGKADLSGATSVDVEITNGSMTINGQSQSQSESQDLGSINVVS